MKVKGFTLLELMVTLVVASILLTIAVPSFQAYLSAGRVRTQADLFMAAIASARGEAIKLNQVVTICERNAGGTACADNGGWENGWIIFSDAGVGGVVNAGTDVVLKKFSAMPANFTMAGDLATSISFLPTGELATTSGSFIICDSTGNVNDAYTVFLNAAGRPRKEKGVDSCEVAEEG